MKRNYFAGIKILGETGVTRGDNFSEYNNNSKLDRGAAVSPDNNAKGDRGDNSNSLSPLVTPYRNEGETPEALKCNDSNMSPPVAPDYLYLREFYNERAAIYEFDAGNNREAAELLALEDTFNEYQTLYVRKK
jgi:hypothetical protein